jgi:hypothetical protein
MSAYRWGARLNTMKTILAVLVLGMAGMPPLARAQSAAAQDAGRDAGTTVLAPLAPLAPDSVDAADSKQMEADLQRLPWKQFRSVIEAVPKMRAQVEAYGTIGWQIVQANYTRYHWQKNIDKLDEVQKKQLVELIRAAKAAR